MKPISLTELNQFDERVLKLASHNLIEGFKKDLKEQKKRQVFMHYISDELWYSKSEWDKIIESITNEIEIDGVEEQKKAKGAVISAKDNASYSLRETNKCYN